MKDLILKDIATDYNFLRELNIQIAVVAGILLVVLVIIALFNEQANERVKKFIFWPMVAVIALSTLFFLGATLYTNFTSLTKGPVHWHADFQIIACGQQIEPLNASGISNKIGSNLLHEHEDRRIHIEGVVMQKGDVTLKNFFAVQGGTLLERSFAIPTNEGLSRYANGDQCANGEIGKWQLFVYRTKESIARQEKLEDFVNYVPSPHTTVPPGDCIIFEFGPEKTQTDALCEFYQLEVNKNKLEIVN